jgi:hypothetical protein
MSDLGRDLSDGAWFMSGPAILEAGLVQRLDGSGPEGIDRSFARESGAGLC